MKQKPRAAKHATGGWELVLAAPDADDVIGLLRAWRIWLLGGLLGALVGAAVYAVFPPPYRARATVNVDFHLEQAWPQNTDREQFYYLERETRKLVEIAMSDVVLTDVGTAEPSMTVEALRAGVLHLSQPGNGGWHFYADHPRADTSELLARTWARAFSSEVERQMAAAPPGNLEEYITLDVAQADYIVPVRRQAEGWYVLAGAGLGLVLVGLTVLFFRFQ